MCTTEATALRCGEAYADGTTSQRLQWNTAAGYSPKSCVAKGRFEAIGQGKKCSTTATLFNNNGVASEHACRKLCRNNNNCMFYSAASRRAVLDPAENQRSYSSVW